MLTDSAPSSEFGDLLRQLEGGDLQARDRLIEHAQGRLRVLVQKMLVRFPQVHQHEDTSDVLHAVFLELHDTLSKVKPKDSKHFLCLASLHIRRKLLDLAKIVARQPVCETDLTDALGAERGQICEPASSSDDPHVLARWTEIHEYIQALPEHERELFDVLFYHDATQVEAAHVLGMPYKTLKTHWIAARLALMERFGDNPFAEDSGPKS